MRIVDNFRILQKIDKQLSDLAAAHGIWLPYADDNMSESELVEEANCAGIPLPKTINKQTLLNALRKFRAAAVNELLGCDPEAWTGDFRTLYDGLWQWFSQTKLPYANAIVAEAALIVIRKARSWCQKKNAQYTSWEGWLVFSVKRMKIMLELNNEEVGALPTRSHNEKSDGRTTTAGLSIREQSRQVLQDANLTELQKQVFIACVIQKIKPQDLALQTGMSVQKIYKENSDATRKFKKYLGDLYGDQLDEIDIELIWYLQFRFDDKGLRTRSSKATKPADRASKEYLYEIIIPWVAEKLKIDIDDVRARLDKINQARRLFESSDEHSD
jgi:DNA-directed RNA polymerase specialized sigma24 family protein